VCFNKLLYLDRERGLEEYKNHFFEKNSSAGLPVIRCDELRHFLYIEESIKPPLSRTGRIAIFIH